MKFSLACFIIIFTVFSGLVFSCKKENTRVANTSNWTFDGVTYKGEMTTWSNDVYDPNNLWSEGSDFKTGNISDVSIFFSRKPTVNKTYNVTYGMSQDSSFCRITLQSINPIDVFTWESYVPTEKVRVTVNSGKISVTFANVSMQQYDYVRHTYQYKSISGTLIEQ